MCLSTIVNFFSMLKTFSKIIIMILCAIFLWLVISYLNSKFGILTPITSILKIVFVSLKKVVSMITGLKLSFLMNK